MHSGDKASPIVYFTLLVGEYCSHMMIKRTLEHVHHNVKIRQILKEVKGKNELNKTILFFHESNKLFLKIL